jgi:hypothetical protein
LGRWILWDQIDNLAIRKPSLISVVRLTTTKHATLDCNPPCTIGHASS